jgi:hypothetical protein
MSAVKTSPNDPVCASWLWSLLMTQLSEYPASLLFVKICPYDQTFRVHGSLILKISTDGPSLGASDSLVVKCWYSLQNIWLSECEVLIQLSEPRSVWSWSADPAFRASGCLIVKCWSGFQNLWLSNYEVLIHLSEPRALLLSSADPAFRTSVCLVMKCSFSFQKLWLSDPEDLCKWSKFRSLWLSGREVLIHLSVRDDLSRWSDLQSLYLSVFFWLSLLVTPLSNYELIFARTLYQRTIPANVHKVLVLLIVIQE